MKIKIALMCYFQKTCYNLADHLLIAWLQVCGTFYWFQETFVVQFCVCSVQLQLLPPSSKVTFPQAILVLQTATSGSLLRIREWGEGEGKGTSRDLGRCLSTYTHTCCCSLCFKLCETGHHWMFYSSRENRREGVGSLVWRYLCCFTSHTPLAGGGGFF